MRLHDPEYPNFGLSETDPNTTGVRHVDLWADNASCSELIAEIRVLEPSVPGCAEIRRSVGLPSLDGAPQPLLARYWAALRSAVDPVAAWNREVEDYIAAHNKCARPAAFTIWAGIGADRTLAARAENQLEAWALARLHAPSAVWGSVATTEPVLRVGRREAGPVDLGGAWVVEEALADCELLRELADGSKCDLPPSRRNRAARWLNRGGGLIDDVFYGVIPVWGIKVGRDGVVHRQAAP